MARSARAAAGGHDGLMSKFILVTDDGTADVDATRAGGSVRVAPEDLPRAVGWELRPEGLCRGDVCVPARDRSALVVEGDVDLGAMGKLLRAPFVADDVADVAVLGASVTDRATERAGMRVAAALPLRDLDGTVHHWGELGRKKKLLFAWASW